MKQNLSIIRRKVRNTVFRSPFLYLSIAAVKGNRFRVRANSDLVIEGFPRSANTFVEAVFRVSQPYIKNYAHHSHAPASVIRAVKIGIPTVVLIRDPLESVTSFLEMYEGNFDADLLFREYFHFYDAVKSFRQGFVLVNYSAVPSKLDRLPSILGDKFGMEISQFKMTKDFIAECYALVDRLNLERNGRLTDRYSPFQKASYRAARQEKLEHLRDRLDVEGNWLAKEKAVSIYQELSATADLS